MSQNNVSRKTADKAVQNAGNIKAIITLLLLAVLAASFYLLPMPLPLPIALIAIILWGIFYKKYDRLEANWYAAVAQPVIEELFPGQGKTAFEKGIHASLLKNLDIGPSGCRLNSCKGMLTKEIRGYLVTMGDFTVNLTSQSANYQLLSYQIEAPVSVSGTFYLSSDKDMIYNHRKNNYKTGDDAFDKKVTVCTSDISFAEHYLNAFTRERILQLVKEYHPVTLYFDSKRIVAISKGSISLFTASSKPTAETYRQQLLKYARFCDELTRLISD